VAIVQRSNPNSTCSTAALALDGREISTEELAAVLASTELLGE
jgi:hypothetical protein